DPVGEAELGGERPILLEARADAGRREARLRDARGHLREGAEEDVDALLRVVARDEEDDRPPRRRSELGERRLLALGREALGVDAVADRDEASGVEAGLARFAPDLLGDDD